MTETSGSSSSVRAWRSARLRHQVAERNLDNVRFVEPQPISRMPQVLALGDVQLVPLRDLPILRRTLPSKVQVALAAGRPIIASADGDVADVVAASGAGFAVPPELTVRPRRRGACGPAGCPSRSAATWAGPADATTTRTSAAGTALRSLSAMLEQCQWQRAGPDMTVPARASRCSAPPVSWAVRRLPPSPRGEPRSSPSTHPRLASMPRTAARTFVRENPALVAELADSIGGWRR